MNLQSFNLRAPSAESHQLRRLGIFKFHFLPAMQTKVAGQALDPIRLMDTIGPEPGERLWREERSRGNIFILGHSSVPVDRGFVKIDEDLFGLKIFFEAPGAEFAPKARLLVTTPGRFDVGRLHVIDPHDAGAK